MPTILSLCDFSGVWSRPYEEAGYQIIRIDLQHGQDIRTIKYLEAPVHGILAAPPCTYFARCGARWRRAKGEAGLLDGLALVDACLRAVAIYRPQWWALENPIGCLKNYLGNPSFTFDPCDFGDPWTKRTLLWGQFTHPTKNPVPATLGSKMHRMSSTWKNQRSETPDGFARAFFSANP